MLTVEDYAKIRLAHRDGLSIRAIAKQYHHSRRKIREVLENPEPEPYTRRKPAPAPKLDPFTPVIDEILKSDDEAPPKQRHTATQIFRRLRDQGYPGGYDQVRRYVAQHRRVTRETFLPLSHDPGQRLEADFGHIYVDFPDGRRQVAVLLVTWAHSYRPFAIALPTERVEAILHGMRAAFEWFGCVAREIWWDNPKTVATAILVGRGRTLHRRYLAFASHYNFEPLFCMPARGNEKPYVENRVKHLQRRWATPVPRVKDLAELNDYLRECCRRDLERVATGQHETIGARFEEDRAAALPLPEHPFDTCLREARNVDKYQTVAFDNNRYSVPRPYAFRAATVKAYVDRIEIVLDGQVVAHHARCYERGQHILDPLHYLSLLGRKPAYLDHTSVFKSWKLPAVFAELRDKLEAEHGSFAGARHFVRVLQLLAKHPLKRVCRAIDQCRTARCLAVDLIRQKTEQLQFDELKHCSSVSLSTVWVNGSSPAVRVPRPNLRCFDRLLSTGGPYDAEIQRPVVAVEGESQAAAAAHYAGRV